MDFRVSRNVWFFFPFPDGTYQFRPRLRTPMTIKTVSVNTCDAPLKQCNF